MLPTGLSTVFRASYLQGCCRSGGPLPGPAHPGNRLFADAEGLIESYLSDFK